MKKVLLIRPNTDKLPEMPRAGHALGLLYISSYLKLHGYEVIVRDLNRQTLEQALLEWIKGGEIAIVGLTMLSYVRKQPYELIRMIKGLNPSAKVVVGGIHAMSLPLELVNNFSIDAAIIGEGEVTMKELADLWIKGEGTLASINGIATKEHGIHKPRELIQDLDTLPFPDYSQTDFSWYGATMAKHRPNLVINGIRLGSAKFGNIITSRGCIGRCKFCNAFLQWGCKIRFRSASNVVAEIKHLKSTYGVNLLCLHDDSFGQDKQIAIDICKGIVNNGLRIIWYTAMRPDDADPELLGWMHKAGCFSIAYGIESGSVTILKNIAKGITVEQIRKAIALTKQAGIKAYALLMIGNQGETDDTIRQTVKLLNETKPDLRSFVGHVMVCPRTAYASMMKQKGKLNDDYWLRAENGLPVFYDNFTFKDLQRWFRMLEAVPNRW